MISKTYLDQPYNYTLLQIGSLPLQPDGRRNLSVAHQCTSVLIWPEGEPPTGENVLVTDPCFTRPGFQQMQLHLEQLGLRLADIGQFFITHLHGDHLPRIPFAEVPPELTLFQVGSAGPLAAISSVPCPGHTPDMQALVFHTAAGQQVWIAGDAILNMAWLKAWGYYWPNGYTPSEVAQTWQSVAKILSQADIVIPGHGPPILVTAPLVNDLLLAFSSAVCAAQCPEVERILKDRLRQLP